MTLDPAVFKAYDIRGIHPGQIDEDGAHRLGRAYVQVTGARSLVVGRDMRVQGRSMQEAFMAGAAEQGADVLDIGLIGTEVLYRATVATGVDGGVAITASHNPPEYTGAKLVRKGSVPISIQTGIGEMRDLAISGEFSASDRRGDISTHDPYPDYVEHVLSYVDPAKIGPLKVVMDAGNGMGGFLFDRLLPSLPGVDPVRLCFEPDGRFPHHQPNPLEEENRKFVIEHVRSEGADLGIAWDGDADRCFFFDASGEFAPGDFITALVAKSVLAKEPGADIVYDLRASWAVADTVRAAGGTAHENRVGHAFIKARMREVDGAFGGEVSGHYYFRRFAFCDTGIIPALLLLELVSQEGPLADQLAQLRAKYHISGEINTTVDDVAAVTERVAERYADGRQTREDGLSVVYDDWHFNLRPSNTEPLLRLNLESLVSEEHMAERRDEVLGVVRA